MATIQISEELDQRLTEAAERMGKSKTALIAEAIQLRFDELQARVAAKERLEDAK